MMFDWLVVGQVMPANPASSVRGPSHVVKHGKAPVLSPEEARRVLDAIDVSTHAGLRDRALIALTFARVGSFDLWAERWRRREATPRSRAASRPVFRLSC
jgi:hypothetical protein